MNSKKGTPGKPTNEAESVVILRQRRLLGIAFYYDHGFFYEHIFYPLSTFVPNFRARLSGKNLAVEANERAAPKVVGKAPKTTKEMQRKRLLIGAFVLVGLVRVGVFATDYYDAAQVKAKIDPNTAPKSQDEIMTKVYKQNVMPPSHTAKDSVAH